MNRDMLDINWDQLQNLCPRSSQQDSRCSRSTPEGRQCLDPWLCRPNSC